MTSHIHSTMKRDLKITPPHRMRILELSLSNENQHLDPISTIAGSCTTDQIHACANKISLTITRCGISQQGVRYGSTSLELNKNYRYEIQDINIHDNLQISRFYQLVEKIWTVQVAAVNTPWLYKRSSIEWMKMMTKRCWYQ